MESPIYTRTEPVLLPYYPRLIYQSLLDMGYRENDLFDGLEISAANLLDEDFRLTIAQHEQFILRVIELTENPHIAVELEKSRVGSEANLAMLTVANSGKISRALHLLTRYSKIFTRVFSIRPLEGDDVAGMSLEPHLEHDSVIYFAIGVFVLFLDRFFSKVLNGEHLVKQVELTIPMPEGFKEVEAEFPFPMVFDSASTRIYFDSKWLDEPMNQADPKTVRLLTEMSEKQLLEAEAEMSFVGSVKSLLIEQVAAPPRLDEAAKLLGVSSRGLRRKLEQSGTSYHKLLDSVRLQMATKLIRETNSPISSIGYELGFSNASDFGRAFKRWSGRSPMSLRQAG